MDIHKFRDSVRKHNPTHLPRDVLQLHRRPDYAVEGEGNLRTITRLDQEAHPWSSHVDLVRELFDYRYGHFDIQLFHECIHRGEPGSLSIYSRNDNLRVGSLLYYEGVPEATRHRRVIGFRTDTSRINSRTVAE